MAQVVVALGSNLEEPLEQLKKAKPFLVELSISPVLCSPIYVSEPIGPSENDFLNAVIILETELSPQDLFEELKEQERLQGRPSRYPKWTARTLDLDIIAYDDLILKSDKLIIPHAEYTRRLFVLLPLADVLPDWTDPKTNQSINTLITAAPEMSISKTNVHW